jgi:outer membrane protein assembly factor BamB
MRYRNPLVFCSNYLLACTVIGLTLWAGTASAQSGSILTSDAVIHQAGLMVEWSSQAPVGASNRLVDWELFVDENQATTTIEVTTGSRREVISQFDRNARGDVMGVEGAEKFAQARKEHILAELAARGKKDVAVTIRKFQQPKATLFLMTDSGDVTAIDANTGKTQWLSRVGEGSGPGIGLGVNATHVAVVRGSFVYCLENATGKELWSKRCKYSVGSSPAVTDKHIMVPLTDGRLELLPLKTQGLGSHALMALGEGTAQPLVTASSVSWPTTRGELNVMIRSTDTHSISYRLRSDDAIVSQATTDGKTLYVGSLDGFLYAIDETRGSIRWAISLGVGISESPVPLGDYVYAISNDNKLYKVVAATGELANGWGTPLEKISRFIGASEGSLYLLDTFGNLVVIDRTSKTIVNRVAVGKIDLVLNNYQNDRLYLASKSGMLQCLREIKSERPYFHGDEPVGKPMEDRTDSDAEGSGSKKPMASQNPFGGSDESENPFGGSGNENPFGGGGDDSDSQDGGDSEDPFGGSSDSEDPFGGSADDEDPFS